jgi:hypothetical protein
MHKYLLTKIEKNIIQISIPNKKAEAILKIVRVRFEMSIHFLKVEIKIYLTTLFTAIVADHRQVSRRI